MTDITIGHVNPQVKKILWIVYLTLTSVILAYPVNLRLEYFPIESLHVFANLPLFGALFYLWAIFLIVLLFTAGEGKGKWERLALVVVVAIVFWGLWNIIAPIQHQALGHATAAQVWQSEGHIVERTGVAYIAWPALSTVTSAISQITGLGLFHAITVQVIFVGIVIAVVAYVFLLSVLRSSLYASLACLLVIWGGQAQTVRYNPGPIGIVFLITLLVVLFQRDGLTKSQYIMVVILLSMAVTLTHLFGAILLFFVMFGLWIFRALRKHQAESWPTMNCMLITLIIPITWMLYWGSTGFNIIVGNIWDSILNPYLIDRLMSGSAVAQASFGGNLPFWLTGPSLFFTVLIYGIGSLAWLWYLFRLPKLSTIESRATAMYLGLVLLTIATGVFLLGGTAELRRSLSYGGFMAAPFLFLFLDRFGVPVKRIILLGLALMLLAASFPLFLNNNRNIATLSFYEPEYSAGKWVQTQYGDGSGITIVATHYASWPLQFAGVTGARYITDMQTHEYTSYDENGVRHAMQELMNAMADSSRARIPTLFIHSPKNAFYLAHFLGLPVDHQIWQSMDEQISGSYSSIYDNGMMQVYTSE